MRAVEELYGCTEVADVKVTAAKALISSLVAALRHQRFPVAALG